MSYKQYHRDITSGMTNWRSSELHMFYAGDKISGIEGPLNGNMYYFYNSVGEPIRRKSSISWGSGGKVVKNAAKEYECWICSADQPQLDSKINIGDTYVRVHKWDTSGAPCHIGCAIHYDIQMYHAKKGQNMWNRDNQVKFKFVNGEVEIDE